MAVPSELTISDLTGVYTMNKSLTDMTVIDNVLYLQGVGWLKRRVITTGTVTLYVKHYKDADNIEHIDIDQTLTGGVPASKEERTLWWKDRETYDSTFGYVVGKSRRVKAEELGEAFLKEGWTADTFERGLVQSYVESDTPRSKTTWIANQAWGIEEINSEKRYVRHLKFTGPGGEDIEQKLVYDYYGPNNSQGAQEGV